MTEPGKAWKSVFCVAYFTNDPVLESRGDVERLLDSIYLLSTHHIKEKMWPGGFQIISKISLQKLLSRLPMGIL